MITRSIFRSRVLIGLIFSGVLIFSLFSYHPYAASDTPAGPTRDQIKEIESKLSTEKQRFKEFDSQEKGLLGQLSLFEQEVSDKKQALGDLREKIRLAKFEIKGLNEKLAGLEESFKNVDLRLGMRLVVLYKYARKGYLKILANAADFGQFRQRVKYLETIIRQDRKSLIKLSGEQLKYKKEIQGIKEELAEKESAQDEKRAKLVALKKDLEKKVIRLMKVHKEKKFYQTSVEELQLAARNLKQALHSIEKKSVFETDWSSRFAESKGRLPFPLKGRIIKCDKLSGSAKTNHEGSVLIVSPSDTEVKAIFPGRIDFSGKLKGFGEVIIINHGSRYYTISAHISRRIKKEGELVEKHGVIGLVGLNGPSKESKLYFEIRRAGKILDALEWLKIR